MAIKDSRYVQTGTLRLGNDSSAYLLCSNGTNLVLRKDRELVSSDGRYVCLSYVYSEEDFNTKLNAVATLSAVKALIGEPKCCSSGNLQLQGRTVIENVTAGGNDIVLDPAQGMFLSSGEPNDSKGLGVHWSEGSTTSTGSISANMTLLGSCGGSVKLSCSGALEGRGKTVTLQSGTSGSSYPSLKLNSSNAVIQAGSSTSPSQVTVGSTNVFLKSGKSSGICKSTLNLTASGITGCAQAISLRAKNSSSGAAANLTLSNQKITLCAQNGLVYAGPFNSSWKTTTSHYIPTVSVIHCLIAASGGGGGGTVTGDYLPIENPLAQGTLGVDVPLGRESRSGRFSVCRVATPNYLSSYGISAPALCLRAYDPNDDSQIDTDVPVLSVITSAGVTVGAAKTSYSSYETSSDTGASFSIKYNPGSPFTTHKIVALIDTPETGYLCSAVPFLFYSPYGSRHNGNSTGYYINYAFSEFLKQEDGSGSVVNKLLDEYGYGIPTLRNVYDLTQFLVNGPCAGSSSGGSSSGGSSSLRFYHEGGSTPSQYTASILLCPNITWEMNAANKRISIRYEGTSFNNGVELEGNLYIAPGGYSYEKGAIVFNFPDNETNHTMLLDTRVAKNLPSQKHTVHPFTSGFAPLTIRSVYPVSMQFICPASTYDITDSSQDLATISMVHALKPASSSTTDYSSCINGLKSTITYLEGKVTTLENEVHNGQSDTPGDSGGSGGGGASSTEITELSNRVTEVETKTESLSSDVKVLDSSVDTLNSCLSSVKSTATTASNNSSTALSTANAAKTAADTASANASNAVTTANAAKTAADSASTNASNAVTTANAAKTTADTASTNASNAVTTANTAKTTADTASTNASNAVTTANAAKTAADSATTSVTGLTTRVNTLDTNYESLNSRVTVLEDASSGGGDSLVDLSQRVTTLEGSVSDMQTDVTSANEKATSASTGVATLNDTTIPAINTRITQVCSSVQVLQGDVSTALTNSNTASTNASNAVTTANAAKTTADTASTNASNAVTTANAAKTAAASASTNASNAVTTANAASTKANANETAITGLTSRVESLETTDTSLGSRVKVLEDSMKDGSGCTCDMETINTQIADLSSSVETQNQAIADIESKVTQQAIDNTISTNATVQKLVTDVSKIDSRVTVLEREQGNSDDNTQRIIALENKDVQHETQLDSMTSTLNAQEAQLSTLTSTVSDHEQRITALEENGGGTGGGTGGEDNPGGGETTPTFPLPEAYPAVVTVDPDKLNTSTVFGVDLNTNERILGLSSAELDKYKEIMINSAANPGGISLGTYFTGVGLVTKVIIPPYMAATTDAAVGEWGINLYARPSYWYGDQLTTSNYACIAKSTNTFKLTRELSTEAQVVNFNMEWRDIEAVNPSTDGLRALFVRKSLDNDVLLRDISFPATRPTSSYTPQTPTGLVYESTENNPQILPSNTHMIMPYIYPEGTGGYAYLVVTSKEPYEEKGFPLIAVAGPNPSGATHVYPATERIVTVDLGSGAWNASNTWQSVYFVSAQIRGELVSYDGQLRQVTINKKPVSYASVPSVYLEVYQTDPDTGDISLIGCSTNSIATINSAQGNPDSTYVWNFSDTTIFKNNTIYFKLATSRSMNVIGSSSPKIYNTTSYPKVGIVWYDYRGSDTIYVADNSRKGSFVGAWPGELVYSYIKS